jgi:predicted ATPase
MMIVTHLKLTNWRNFQSVEVDLGRRMFLVGPNASGKSNLLDVFRFLRDIAALEGGGLQRALKERGGLKKIRCLSARRSPAVGIEIHLGEDSQQQALYKYAIGISQENSGLRRLLLTYEKVWQNDTLILDRPNEEDNKDAMRLTETYLEQISRNADFRDVAYFFQSTLYLHLVPQLVRHAREYSGPGIPGDPYGRNFLERIAHADERTKQARLRKIERALQLVVPQMKELKHVIDVKEGGVPHLEVIYEHWRPHGARQRETELSDGTLRLIGLFWTMLEGESLLLLEEPELSLNAEVIRKLPALFSKLLKQTKKSRQILVSTHSWELLSDRGIGGEETLLLMPGTEGTDVRLASSNKDIRHLLEEGDLSVADAVLPKTAPAKMSAGAQLDLFS